MSLRLIFTLGYLMFLGNLSGQVNPDSIPASPIDSTVEEVYAPETSAQFPGGEDSLIAFINRTMIYPEEAKNERFSGTVWVLFTVEKDGQITNGEIKFSVHPCLDEEALRVVHLLPRWLPATQNGKMVRSFYLLPIRFDLQEQKF